MQIKLDNHLPIGSVNNQKTWFFFQGRFSLQSSIWEASYSDTNTLSTGSTTPYPEADHPTPLTVLPAVVSTLPNLEHHLAENLQQRSILDSQCGTGDSMSDSGREHGSLDGNAHYQGSLVRERDGSDGNSNSYGNERYSGSLSGLNEVLEGRNGYSKLKNDTGPRESNSKNNPEDDMQEDDLLELPMLLGSESSQITAKKASRSPTHNLKAESDGLKDRDHNEENLLEYALSLLEGTHGSGRGAIGWGPVDTSLSRESESSTQSASGQEGGTDKAEGNNLRVNPLFGEREGRGTTDEGQKTSTVEAQEAPVDLKVEHQHGSSGEKLCYHI